VPASDADARYRMLTESVKDYAIFMTDDDGYVQTWNDGAACLKGYDADEAIGLHFSAFYPEEDVAAGKCDEALEVALREGRCEREGWRVRKDGGRFWANAILTPVRDDGGVVVGFAEVTRDLTLRQAADMALHESEERFRLLVASVKDYAIFVLDPTGHVATWNAGAQRIKGYAPDDIIGAHFSRFYSAEDVASGKCEMELEVAARVGRFEDEGWRVRKDGSRFWANVVLTALRDESGALVGFAKVTRDLTDRRRAEEERLRLTQAQEAVRLRDDFLSIASHELNTPLTTTKMQIDSLLEQQDLGPRILPKVERIARSVSRLVQLIDALLDVSRLTTGRLTLNAAEVDLVRLARDVVERTQEAAIRARCALSVSVGGDVEEGALAGEWDALRVEQVITNVIGNALKYAPGAPVEVVLTREGDAAVVRVIDHGAGIPCADLERIFERFERASSARNFGGLGLGLFVSREIVLAHGGTIAAANMAAGGACITARLPLRRKEATP
jgi:PAS domain S-box-containing protein